MLAPWSLADGISAIRRSRPWRFLSDAKINRRPIGRPNLLGVHLHVAHGDEDIIIGAVAAGRAANRHWPDEICSQQMRSGRGSAASLNSKE